MKRILISSLMLSAMILAVGCQQDKKGQADDAQEASVGVDENGYPVNGGWNTVRNGGAVGGSPLQGTWVSTECKPTNYFAPNNMGYPPVVAPYGNPYNPYGSASVARQTARLVFNGGRGGEVTVYVDNYLDQVCSPGSRQDLPVRYTPGSYRITAALITHELVVGVSLGECLGGSCPPNDPYTEIFKANKLAIRQLGDGNMIEIGRFAPGGTGVFYDTNTQYRRVAE